MATLEHVELDTLQLGMPVLLGGREIGRLEDIIPQPDRRHALRLITRQQDNRLVAIPVDWVRDIRDGRIELAVTSAEIDQLPDYVPIIRAGRDRMPAAVVNGRTTTSRVSFNCSRSSSSLPMREFAPRSTTRRTEIPRLMAGLLILTARVVALLESEDSRVSPKRPSRRAVERAEALLDLTLETFATCKSTPPSPARGD